ncbi:caspase domain-containing protein [Mycena vulgaris]|nr:caspase domain-containing protein [Mycena vulgaris]
MTDINLESVLALIIGIDTYHPESKIPPLQGCVRDAGKFKTYLDGLGVPISHVVFLQNKEATRAEILKKIQSHFLENTRIQEPIMIFYFAGHGSRAKLLGSNEEVETICPYDERTNIQESDGQAKYVHGIPDYILKSLWHKVSEKQGKNITLIFDSCHSGGMARTPEDAGTRARNVPPKEPIPPDLDRDLHPDGSSRGKLSGAGPYALLAACREDETAREVDDGGRFTASLIDSLRCVHPPLKYTTYDELLMSPRMSTWQTQHPHTAGDHRDRLVFTHKYPLAGRGATLLTIQGSPPIISIAMGHLRGVVEGTEFSVQGPDGETMQVSVNGKTSVCTLVATTVHIRESILAIQLPEGISPGEIAEGSRARVSAWNNDKMVLRVCLELGFVHTSVVFPERKDTDRGLLHKHVRASSTNDPHVVLRCVGEEVVIKQPKMPGAREKRVSVNSKPDHLVKILDAIAHFNYFLYLNPSPANGPDPSIANSESLKPTLAMYRLHGEWPRASPDRTKDLVKTVSDWNEVTLKNDPKADYGFTITNKLEVDVYPYLFYFNPVECIIQDWYMPDGENSTAPLKSKGTLEIGMGTQGPFEFKLPAGMKSSWGFLKLFVSAQNLDLHGIEQPISPFHPDFSGRDRIEAGRKKGVILKYWDECRIDITLTA